ncbi:MAG: hypothetical protein OXD46_00015 [Chloroflexi bacterium]|nr:hypothetical protein [Chloroflexota bacterium]
MKKIYDLLTRFTTNKIAIGGLVFMVAYMIRSSSVGCPLCGNQGLHPWEWGGFVGL